MSQPVEQKPLILWVSHQAELSQPYQQLLESKGYQVEMVMDGLEAIHQIYHCLPHLVIADVIVPEVNGYQLCRLLKNDSVTQKIPFILLSRYGHKIDKFWGFKAGADAFIHQDQIEQHLLAQVEMLIGIYQQIRPVQENTYAKQASIDSQRVRIRLNQILDKSLIESTLMTEFRGLSDMVHDRNLLNYMLYSLVESIVEYDVAAVFYHDQNRDPRVASFHVPDGKVLTETGYDHLKVDFFERIPSPLNQESVFSLRDFELIGTLSEEAEFDFKTSYFVPFIVDNTLIGAVAFYSKELMDYADIFPVKLVLHEIQLLMKLRHLYSQAEILAITDGLTGLFNYRHFVNILEREFQRSKRYQLIFSLALIDIDYFKQCNDQWGHLAGDEVLRHIASRTETLFRQIDLVARYGGEELMVIFPETSLESAHIACERFRAEIEKAVILEQEPDFKVTVSIGLVECNEAIQSTSDLIKKADQALYQAKQLGRNRVELSL